MSVESTWLKRLDQPNAQMFLIAQLEKEKKQIIL